jgi:hypothetical protein
VGTEKSTIQWNDNLIPYYRHAAQFFGVHIATKPLERLVGELLRINKKFHSGDPMHDLNRFSTPFIMPGVTQKFVPTPIDIPTTQQVVPDLMLVIDSSGSMRHPQNRSYATLAGAILTNAYLANDSHVGVLNFSVNSMLLPPTRNWHHIYSALCAYYGGGTVYDIEIMKGIFRMLNEEIPQNMKEMSDDELRHLAHRLPPGQLEKIERKEVNVVLDHRLQKTYSRFDNILITDGGIANLQELVAYMDQIANYTRNIIVVVDNKPFADEARKLPNVQVYSADKDEDLVKFSITHTNKL